MERGHHISTFKLPALVLANLGTHVDSARSGEAHDATVNQASATQHNPTPLMTPPTEQRLPDTIEMDLLSSPNAKALPSSSLSGIDTPPPDAEGQAAGFRPINGIVGGKTQSDFSPFILAQVRAASPARGRVSSQTANQQAEPVLWTAEEDNILCMWCPFVESHHISWLYLATKFPKKTHAMCKSRWNFLKKTKGEAAAVKLEPEAYLTNDMFQITRPKIELDGPQQDELWHLGIKKYTDDISWAEVANRHSQDWTSTGKDGKISTGAPAANTCGRWGTMLQKKCAEVAAGVTLEAWRPVGSEQKIPILPAPNLSTWENCPPKLRTRLESDGSDGFHKRRAGGSLALSTRMGINSPVPEHPAKRARVLPGAEATVDAKDTQVEEQTSQGPFQPILPQRPKTRNTAGVHTTFDKITDISSSCTWCRTSAHPILYRCLQCEALLCKSCLESKDMTIHRLPQPTSPINGGGNTIDDARNTSTNVPIIQDPANYGDDEPLRQRHERLAKTKAQAQVREAVKQFEPWRPVLTPKSSPRAKKSSAEKRKSPTNQKKRLSATAPPDRAQSEWKWSDDGSSTAYESDDGANRMTTSGRKKTKHAALDKSRAARKAAPSARHQAVTSKTSSPEADAHRESQAVCNVRAPSGVEESKISGSGEPSGVRQSFDPVRDTAPRTIQRPVDQRPADIETTGPHTSAVIPGQPSLVENARSGARVRAIQSPPVAHYHTFTLPVAKNQLQHARGRSVQSLPNHPAGLMSPITATGSPTDFVRQPQFPAANTAARQTQPFHIVPSGQADLSSGRDARMVGPPWSQSMPAMSQPNPMVQPVATAYDNSDDEDDLAHQQEMARLRQETERLRQQKEEDEKAIREEKRRQKKLARDQERQRLIEAHEAAAAEARDARERRNRVGLAPAGPPAGSRFG